MTIPPYENPASPSPPPRENKSAFEEQVQDKDTWLRLFYIILFGLIFYVVFFVTCVVGVIQFVTRMLTGRPLASLQDFNTTLATYAHDLVAYITYASDMKPFPFKE